LCQYFFDKTIDSSLNSCTIGDGAFIGVGCYVGAGTTIAPGAFVAAGSIIPDGSNVPSGKVWAGNPAKFLRDLTAIERESLKEQHQEFIKLAEVYCERKFLLLKTLKRALESSSIRSTTEQPWRTHLSVSSSP